MDIRLVPQGYTLYQEHGFTTAPFAPTRLVEMLDAFDQQYQENTSSLRLRLGQG